MLTPVLCQILEVCLYFCFGLCFCSANIVRCFPLFFKSKVILKGNFSGLSCCQLRKSNLILTGFYCILMDCLTFKRKFNLSLEILYKIYKQIRSHFQADKLKNANIRSKINVLIEFEHLLAFLWKWVSLDKELDVLALSLKKTFYHLNVWLLIHRIFNAVSW